jgi:hypothetical protein
LGQGRPPSKVIGASLIEFSANERLDHKKKSLLQRERHEMKTTDFWFKVLFVPVSVAAGALLGQGMIALAVPAPRPTQKIEIMIHSGEARAVYGSTIHGFRTEMIIRNWDDVTHGFTSSLFFEDKLRVYMSGGSLAEGKGEYVYRVEPGEVMTIRFTVPAKPGVGSRTYPFWCDMHHSMKGEMFVMGAKVGEL